MATCEKCWSDANSAMTGDTAAEYHRLVAERKDHPCTPEEQCGEIHMVLAWHDRPDQCRCGKVVKSGFLCVQCHVSRATAHDLCSRCARKGDGHA